MAAIHETAYPRIKPNLSHKEIKEIFTPNQEEIDFLNAKTKKTLPIPRLGFMISLKFYQYLGRPVSMKKIETSVKKYITEKIELENIVDISRYSKLTRHRHLIVIREYLQIKSDKKLRQQVMRETALNAATTKENLADIINCMIEELVKSRFELPKFQKFVRIARAARTFVNNENYSKIFNALSFDQKNLIDEIIGLKNNADNKSVNADQNTELLSWTMLKIEAKKPTSNNIKQYIQYVNRMKVLRQKFNVNLDFIAPARIEQLRDEAIIADIHDMQVMRPIKRYSLVVIFIYMKTAAAIDDLSSVFITWIKNIESKARESLENYRLESADKTDEFVVLLYKTLLELKSNANSDEKIKAMERNLGRDADEIIEECREYLGLTTESHIPWMLKPYNNKRHIIFDLLDNLSICSSSNDKSIETALQFITHYRHSHKEWIDLDATASIQPNLDLLTEGWYKAVTGLKREKNQVIKKINRHYYEIAVGTVLMDDLSCGDAYVRDSFVFDDPSKQFISWDQFFNELNQYCDIVKHPTSATEFVTRKKLELHKTALKVDQNYHENPYLIIENKLPVLKKLPKKKEHPLLEKIRQLIADEMPVKSIVEVIIDVENWLKLSVYFKPQSGYETKISDYSSRFVVTSFSYGCNVGPTQTERSIIKYTRKQIAWLFNHHANEQKLLKTIKFINNSYSTFDLPGHWGAGDSVSVDGTFCDMYKQNLLAAHHIRYGRYGGVGYYHVSDQYIAKFSNFISCGAHESIYLLDGIVENDPDVKVKKVHGDSWAQSEVLFGLAVLLAIMLMPRIKQFKHLNYYRSSCTDRYENIDELFTEKPIDWELIETYYHDMLRVAMSIHKGKVKASTILRKFCLKSRKNRLYFALRELGRVERTMFLLNYINDAEMRRMIQAATCKSEEFNQFIGWLRFGDGGVISDNMKANQLKIIRFNHLLANMLIFHTVVHQTKAINKLRASGIEIPNEVLSGISPYWTEHLNRFGMFQLDMEKAVSEIEYDLVDIGLETEI